MKYLILIYGNEQRMLSASKEATLEVEAAYAGYIEAMKAAGVHLASQRLKPTSTARTARMSAGKLSVVDGPFAETKEQLGGFCLIEVPDAEAAVAWASRCPGAAHGSIEVRPIWQL